MKMASLSRLRPLFLIRTRNFTTATLTPHQPHPPYSKEKSRAALSHVKAEQDPKKIIQICQSASLNPDYHLDRIAFSVAIQKLSKSTASSSLIPDFLHNLRRSCPDLHPDRFAAHSIVLLAQANLLHHSILTFEDYHRKSLNDPVSNPGSVRQFNALLFACILTKDYDKVIEIFTEFSRVYNIEPNLQSYNTVIKAYSRSGHSGLVYSLLTTMDRKRVKPNATSFGEWLSGLYREEKLQEIGKVVNMMSYVYKIHPGIGTYNIRIQCLCKLRKSQEAKSLFEGMLSKGMKPNSDTFCHLIHGFCREGDMDEAKRLYRNMRSIGCQPDYNCYSTLAYYMCEAGEFEDAYGISKQSIEKGWVPNITIMISLVEGLGRIGKLWEAKELLCKIKGKFTRNVGMWNEVEMGLLR